MEEIIVPSGIGDGLWVAQTLDPEKEYHVKIADQGKQRGHKFWELIPNVKKISYVKGRWEKICTHELNSKLHEGIHLEDCGHSINWDLPLKVKTVDKQKAAKLITKKGRASNRTYIGIYCSSYETSKALGGWSIEHWKKLLNGLAEIYPDAYFVFLGAEYDDLTKDLALATTKYPKADLTGNSIGETIEILKRLDLMVGFQSGIGCLSTYLNKYTIMLFAKRYEKMQSTFCRKESIGKNWKGCQFCAPEQLLDWFKKEWA